MSEQAKLGEPHYELVHAVQRVFEVDIERLLDTEMADVAREAQDSVRWFEFGSPRSTARAVEYGRKVFRGLGEGRRGRRDRAVDD